MNITHIHCSSRFDKSPQSLTNQMNSFIKSDKKPNVLTWTEVGSAARGDALGKDGWGTYAPDTKTDCAIMWKKSDFSLVDKHTNQLGSKTFKNGDGNNMKIITTIVVLKATDNKKVLWVSVAHLPSSVQNGHQFSGAKTDADRVACWKSAVNDWQTTRSNQRKTYNVDTMMHVADWNVDCRMGDWRNEIDHRLASNPDNFRGTWTSNNAPSNGTHGKRLIDSTWTNGKFQQTGLMPDDDSSDHRPYFEVLGWSGK